MASATRPNIILLVCDTLRPDVLSCYGGSVHTSAFDTLANDGVRFENAFAVGPATPMSHGALFTGQYPSMTGVTGSTRLPADVPVIGGHLCEHGYDTVGIAGPAKISSERGFDRGFDDYYELYDRSWQLSSPQYFRHIVSNGDHRRSLIRHLVRTLRRGPDDQTGLKFDILRDLISKTVDRPFYAFVNVTTAHAPYDPPRPFKENATPELSRPSTYLQEWLTDATQRYTDPSVRADRVFNAQRPDGVASYLADPSYLTDDELAVLKSWYRAEVRYLNTQLERFLTWLDDSDYSEETVLIVTSDHGEYLGEHGLLSHSHFLFDPVLRVPLLLRGPGIESGVVADGLASLIDVFDTVCDLAGVDSPSETVGKSLLDSPARDAVFAEYGPRDGIEASHGRYLDDQRLARFEAGQKSVRTDDHRLVVDSNGQSTLYTYPGETRVDDPETTADLDDLLTATLGDNWHPGDDTSPSSAAVRENLRRLGYLE